VTIRTLAPLTLEVPAIWALVYPSVTRRAAPPIGVGLRRLIPAARSKPSESEENRPAAGGGHGAKALGFEPGQRIEREPYDLLFGERQGFRRRPAWATLG
jgi:hypothetical protein